MSISVFDAAVMENNGFTPSEIETIAQARTPSGALQPPVNLENEYWMDALADHRSVMDAFTRVMISRDMDFDRDDYNDFINIWYREIVKAADPWVWIDQFYLRYKLGKVTKARYLDAQNKVNALKSRIY